MVNILLPGFRKPKRSRYQPTELVDRGLLPSIVCLELHGKKVSITELQSAFATPLAKYKYAWRLNSLLQEAVMRLAKRSRIPVEFVANVLGEARRAKAATRRL